VSSNNPAAPPAYFEAIKRTLGTDGEVNFLLDAARGYRGARVSDRISSEAPHDMENFVSIQMDTYVDGLRNSLQPVFDATRQSPSPCRSTLEAWRGDFAVDSAGALVLAHFWTEVLDSVYAPHFPAGLKPKVGMTELLSLETILADADSGWWDDPRTNEPESRDDRLPALLDAACEGVEAAHGDNPERWAWGDVHRAAFKNEILNGSGVGILKRFGNRGPISTAGGAGTVSIGRWRHGSGYNEIHIPGYRFIIDLAAPDQALAINSTGQSSHPASPHYADQMEKWAAGDYDIRRFDEGSVRRSAKTVIELEPAEED
ncbi:MAG: penicillin acylase family protein, partial [Pseudomonadota bacterium]